MDEEAPEEGLEEVEFARRYWAERRRGQRGAGRPGFGSAPITLTIIALDTLIFLFAEGGLSHPAGISPVRLLALGGISGVTGLNLYNLVAAIFLHVSLVHLGMNMLSLYILGSMLEGRLGTGWYLAVYFAAGIFGNVIEYLLAPPYAVAVGASGAIFGLVGALLVEAYESRNSALWNWLLAMILLNVVFDAAMPFIGWQAHLGGFLAGIAVGWLAWWQPRAAARNRRRRWLDEDDEE